MALRCLAVGPGQDRPSAQPELNRITGGVARSFGWGCDKSCTLPSDVGQETRISAYICMAFTRPANLADLPHFAWDLGWALDLSVASFLAHVPSCCCASPSNWLAALSSCSSCHESKHQKSHVHTLHKISDLFDEFPLRLHPSSAIASVEIPSLLAG